MYYRVLEKKVEEEIGFFVRSRNWVTSSEVVGACPLVLRSAVLRLLEKFIRDGGFCDGWYENKQDGARLIKRVNEVRWDRKEKWARFLPEQSDNV